MPNKAKHEKAKHEPLPGRTPEASLNESPRLILGPLDPSLEARNG